MDLSIIIVSYESKDRLATLLPSIFNSEEVAFGQKPMPPKVPLSGSSVQFNAEVIIVDNGSTDGTGLWLEKQQQQTGKFHYIKSSNLGFSAGNNLGIRKSTGKYILLLNPDTELFPDTLNTMLEFMDSNPEVGISGCKLVKADGGLDLACRRRFPNPWNSFQRLFLKNNRNYNYSELDENLSMEVDSVVGAFLLIRKSVIDKIGLLDEKFYMYGEDLDWCWRCKAAGFKVWYYSNTQAFHFKGSSSKKTPYRMLKAFHDSMWIFYNKHYSEQYPFILNWLVFAGIYGRLAALEIINFFKKNPVVSK
jgi:GT2 family glycosyltransferase